MKRRDDRIVLTKAIVGIFFLTNIILVVEATQIGGMTERVSVNAMGEEGNGDSEFPAVSADGRFVAFSSSADNLVADDTNGLRDIFVVDRETGLVERVNVSSMGEQANGTSGRWADISADGRFVTFDSIASNLVISDTNGLYDIFVHDRWTGITERVSVHTSGAESNGNSFFPAISADGRFVVYDSDASNLVTTPLTGGKNIFLRDLETEETELISMNADGEQGFGSDLDPSISADGRFVAYESTSTNLIPDDTIDSFYDIYIHDRQKGLTEKIWALNGNISDDSSYSPQISGNGQFVLFTSYATNLIENMSEARTAHVYLYDREAQTIIRVSQNVAGIPGFDSSFAGEITYNGAFMLFTSFAENLVPDDSNGETDVFIYHRPSGWLQKASVSSLGVQGNGKSADGDITADGWQIVFYSEADNLVSKDENMSSDIFMHEWQLFFQYLPITAKQ